LGEPAGEIRRYIDWILSDAGQQIVAEAGYVPVARGDRTVADTTVERP
jgi:ABC-type Fe3+ transport system substrate-binding protein